MPAALTTVKTAETLDVINLVEGFTGIVVALDYTATVGARTCDSSDHVTYIYLLL